jgi:hypothetical protein
VNFQGALEALASSFITFYLGCALMGHPEIPWGAVYQLRAMALAGTKASWGCPSAFHREACWAYDPSRYREK